MQEEPATSADEPAATGPAAVAGQAAANAAPADAEVAEVPTAPEVVGIVAVEPAALVAAGTVEAAPAASEVAHWLAHRVAADRLAANSRQPTAQPVSVDDHPSADRSSNAPARDAGEGSAETVLSSARHYRTPRLAHDRHCVAEPLRCDC